MPGSKFVLYLTFAAVDVQKPYDLVGCAQLCFKFSARCFRESKYSFDRFVRFTGSSMLSLKRNAEVGLNFQHQDIAAQLKSSSIEETIPSIDHKPPGMFTVLLILLMVFAAHFISNDKEQLELGKGHYSILGRLTWKHLLRTSLP